MFAGRNIFGYNWTLVELKRHNEICQYWRAEVIIEP